MFEQVEELLEEYAELEEQLADPAIHADAGAARRLGRRFAELGPVVAAYRAWRQTERRRSAPRANSPTEDPRSGPRRFSSPSRRVTSSRTSCGCCSCRATPTTTKDVILEVKAGGGRRRVGAVRRRPAAHVPAVRRTPRLEDRGPRRPGVRPRRVQGGVGRDQGARTPEGRAEASWARLKYEGGVHRVQRVPVTESQGRIHTSAAGVLVLPEAEDVEVDDRRQRPADRRVPQLRSWRAERQHHRLRRSHHPRADRHRRQLPEREVAAAEQGAGDAHPACAPARCRAGGGRRGSGSTRGVRRYAPSTAPSGSARTTSPRTASPTIASATRRTTSTRCSTAISTRWCRRASMPTWRPGSVRLRSRRDHRARCRRGRHARARRRRGPVAALRRRGAARLAAGM